MQLKNPLTVANAGTTMDVVEIALNYPNKTAVIGISIAGASPQIGHVKDGVSTGFARKVGATHAGELIKAHEVLTATGFTDFAASDLSTPGSVMATLKALGFFDPATLEEKP